MVIHLDTNQLIFAGQRGSPAHQRIDQLLRAGEILQVSSVAWAEFLCGPVTPTEKAHAQAILSDILPLDATSAALGATLFNASGRRSRSLEDCLIAATALLQPAPLATDNPADFQCFMPHGLRLI